MKTQFFAANFYLKLPGAMGRGYGGKETVQGVLGGVALRDRLRGRCDRGLGALSRPDLQQEDPARELQPQGACGAGIGLRGLPHLP